MSTNNKRNFFRLTFTVPLGADVKIFGMGDLDPETKLYKAALVDLSAGGARFFTQAPLPDKPGLLTELRFMCLGHEYRPYGPIVRSILPEPGHYEYCIQFSLDDTDTSALTRMLNQLAIKLRRTPNVPGCSFLTPEETAEFEHF
ncbi:MULTISPECIES: PilZ domain-containing protein [Paenibacillus]|uniref:PilZ domain-containing protein n=1 Tax=Paenibacillus validus TaxID=44253 RepID=A0A7X2ZDY3_9BACL|nr:MULTISPECIES: PilZ domain-containing protein [Paenibacillus]MUG73069.1 PilZ domain-containing protein [Paenibacillus validus]